MSSMNENLEDFYGAYVNSKEDCTNKEQRCINQCSYQKPDQNNNGLSEFYNKSTVHKVSSNLHTISHHQVPDFFQELEIMSELSSDSIMDSMICKIQPATQNSVSSSLSYQDQELHRKIESLFEAMSSGMDSLTYQIQTFEQDPLPPSSSGQDWDCYPVIEFSPKISNNCIDNSFEYTGNGSSTKQIEFSIQSLPNSEFDLDLLSEPEIHLPYENQSVMQDTSLSDSDVILDLLSKQKIHPPYENQSGMQDTLTLFGSANSAKDSLSEIPQTKKPKCNRFRCQCPNCSVKGGNKMRDSKGQLQHVCHVPHCMKVFSKTSSLKRHLAIHKNYSCAYCHQEFELEHEIRAHIEKHMTGKMTHVCPFSNCGKVYSQPGSLYRHLASHNNNNNFICPYCYKEFSRNYMLEAHLEVHIQRKKCQCPNCSVKGGNNIRDSKGRPLHNCHIPNCGKVFKKTCYLKKHLESNCGKRRYICAQCNEGFYRKDYLELHVKSHMPAKHPKRCQCLQCNAKDGNKLNNPNYKHICDFPDCNKVFTKAYDLKRHLSVHSCKDNFFCAHCNKGFKCKSYLILHIKRHLTAKEYGHKNSNINARASRNSIAENKISQKSKRTKCQCPYCRVEGGNKIRDSNGKLQHICHYPNCGRIFSRTSHLKDHLSRHSGERHLMCAHCDKGFMTMNGLKSHLKIHMAGYKQNKRQIPTAAQNVPIRPKPSMENHTLPDVTINEENFELLLRKLQKGFIVGECSQPSH